METWPTGVPSIAARNTQHGSPFRAPLATDFEDGNQRRRRSTTKNIATLTFDLKMTNAQFLTFKAWVRDDLVDGTLPFTASIYTGDIAETKVCTFVERYQDDAADGMHHVVSMTLDVEDY